MTVLILPGELTSKSSASLLLLMLSVSHAFNNLSDSSIRVRKFSSLSNKFSLSLRAACNSLLMRKDLKIKKKNQSSIQQQVSLTALISTLWFL